VTVWGMSPRHSAWAGPRLRSAARQPQHFGAAVDTDAWVARCPNNSIIRRCGADIDGLPSVRPAHLIAALLRPTANDGVRGPVACMGGKPRVGSRPPFGHTALERAT
jgi:hypothetical protein